jgi:hypothetical protein
MQVNATHRLARFAAAIVLCYLACMTAFGQGHLLTAPRDITQLTSKAQIVIRGKVINTKREPHPQYSNIQTIVVTLRVKETLKGAPSEIYTFRQALFGLPQSPSSAYSRGAELILFMHPVNENGLTSPVGVSQGIFTVTRDQAGKATVMNGAANQGLFGDTTVRKSLATLNVSPAMRSQIASKRAGPVDLDSMQSLIRQLATGVGR